MDTTSPKPAIGYKKKPIWIYITSFVLIFSPLGNLLWSLASMNVPGWYKPSVWIYWARFVTIPTWALLALLFTAGVSLLSVRRWSWTLSVGVISIICIYDLFMIKHFLALGTGAVVAMIAGTISFGLILYFSEFRKPYLNPRLRWWETSPRYRVRLPASFSNFEKEGTLADISRTGLLIEWPSGTEVPNLEGTCTITLPSGLQLPAIIRRRTSNGYGAQFTDLSKQQKHDLQEFLKTLELDPTRVAR